MHSDETNLAYIKFLLPVLRDIQRVNKSFEFSDSDPTKLLNDLVLLTKSLVQKIVWPTSKVDPPEGNIEDVFYPKPCLGYQFEKEVETMEQKEYSKDQEKTLRGRHVEKSYLRLLK